MKQRHMPSGYILVRFMAGESIGSLVFSLDDSRDRIEQIIRRELNRNPASKRSRAGKR